MGSPFYVAAGRAACYTKGKRSVLGKKGAEMKGHRRGQQGAILVLTAFLLPFIIAFTGMAVDFGSAYVRRSQLQNAADAAVLAGAYHLDDDKADDVVLQYLKTNLDPHFTNYSYQTGDDFPDKFETLNYHTDKQKDELDVTLRSSVEASFLKLFDINTIPVSVTATAKVSSEDNPSVPSDDMFNYAITVGKEASRSDNYNNPNESGLYIHTDGVTIDGNIRTNGRIAMDQTRTNTLLGKIYTSEDVTYGTPKLKKFDYDGFKGTVDIDPNVWGRYGWYQDEKDGKMKEEFYTFLDGNKTPISQMKQKYPDEPAYKDIYYYKTDSDKVKYGDNIDISIEKNKGIQSLIEQYRKMKPEDREKNHVFYDDDKNKKDWDYSFNSWKDNPQKTYPNLTINGRNNYYRVIIVPGNLKVSFKDSLQPTKDEFFIFISLYGNITVPCDLPELNGIIYAPNKKKTVTIEKYNTDFNGSIIADRVLITGGNKTIKWVNYLSGNSSSSGAGKKTVHLVK
jgi:Flp pilus assembly protein TadG